MPRFDIFRHSTEALSFPAGTIIFERGAAGDRAYVIVSGEVEILLPGGRAVVIGEGEMFGELALIDDQPRSATASARTDTRAMPLDEKRFLFLVQQTPFFALQVMRMLAERLRAASTLS